MLLTQCCLDQVTNGGGSGRLRLFGGKSQLHLQLLSSIVSYTSSPDLVQQLCVLVLLFLFIIVAEAGSVRQRLNVLWCVNSEGSSKRC
jgi:hypothetical protein